MFRIGLLVGVAYGIAEQQVLFAERVGVLALDGGVGVSRLPDASVVQVLEVFGSVEIEKVRIGVVLVAFCHVEFQRQKVRHHDFRALRGELAEGSVVISPELVGVVLHVFPVDSVEPPCRP